MEEITRKVFSEVNEIINHLEIKNQNKIPQSVRDFIRANTDENYIMNINFDKPLVSQNLLDETNVILSILYREYIRDKSIRAEFKRQNEKNYTDLKEQYSFLWPKMTEKKQEIAGNCEQNESNLPIQTENTSWYKKIYSVIKKLLFKKK